MFHLEPPRGFQSFDRLGELFYYKRHLPHWRQKGATYFVTFRLSDSLPAEALRDLKELKSDLDDDATEANEELSRAKMVKIEKWLDSGIGECLFRDTVNREIVSDALLALNGRDYELGAFVVMPNHVHAIIRPFDSSSLEHILKGRKQWTSRLINKRTGKSGTRWQDETYDRIIRDAEHLWKALQYIGRNPEKAGLDEKQATRWVSPDWQTLGWNFESTEK